MTRPGAANPSSGQVAPVTLAGFHRGLCSLALFRIRRIANQCLGLVPIAILIQVDIKRGVTTLCL